MGRKQMYEVEIKSLALIKEGKKGLITYFQGGKPETIASNVRVLYPQYTKTEDKAIVNITPIKYKEYLARVNGEPIKQKQQSYTARANVMKVEDYETVGN